MALTQTDLDNLDKAIASEVLEVRVEGTLTKYRDMSELIKARNFVASQVQAPQDSTGGVRYFRFAGSRD